MRIRSLLPWCLGVATAMVFCATTANASLNLCQKEIELRAQLFNSKLTTALTNCKNAIRTEQVKNATKPGTGFLGTAANTCEIQLRKIYGANFTGKSQVTLFREKMAQASNGKCTKGSNNGTVCQSDTQCTDIPAECNSLKCAKSTTNGSACTTAADCTPVHAVCNAKCRIEDLASQTGVGHLLSGAAVGSAPPVGASSVTIGTKVYDTTASRWTTDWLLVAMEKLAIKKQLFIVPDFPNLISAAVGAIPEKISGTGVASKKGTVCGNPFDANLFAYRPNLCRFGVECRDHACQLDSDNPAQASGGRCITDCSNQGTTCTVEGDCTGCSTPAPHCVASASAITSAGLSVLNGGNPLTIVFPLSGRTALEVCHMGDDHGYCKLMTATLCDTDDDCGVNGPCIFPPGGGLGAGTTDDSLGNSSDIIYLINEPARTVNPPAIPPVVTAVCIDGVRSEGWCDCNNTGIKLNTDFCLDHRLGTGSSCTGDTLATDPDNTFQGSTTGRVVITPGGSSTTGDCFDLNTIQFTIFTDAADYGPDGVPCTSDDRVAGQAPAAVPFTTGTAVASVKDSVVTPGECFVATTDALARPCIEDVNCHYCSADLDRWCSVDSDCDSPQTCNTADTCDLTNLDLQDIAAGPFVGNKLTSCANMEASNMSGMRLVGAFPALNGGGGLGDSTTAFQFTCQ